MKVGFIGCGHIARTMAETVNNTKGFELYCVAARDLDRANAFKDEFGAKKAYGSYEELVADDNVELVNLDWNLYQKWRNQMNKTNLCDRYKTDIQKFIKQVINFILMYQIFLMIKQ